MTTLVLGDARIDLVGTAPAAGPAEAEAYAPEVGGPGARAALALARHGVPTSLAGGTGDDGWGHWVRERLEDDAVDLTWFRHVVGARTPVGFRVRTAGGATLADPDPRSSEELLAAVRTQVAEAVHASDGLHLPAGVLVPRGTAHDAVAAARDAGRTVSLELGADDDGGAVLAGGVAIVVADHDAAAAVTGQADAAEAAGVLVDRGARLAVVLAPGAAHLRGAGLDRDALAGAGPAPSSDELAAGLVAALALSGGYAAAAAAALPALLAGRPIP